jgi:hypothetical protein
MDTPGFGLDNLNISTDEGPEGHEIASYRPG